MNKIKKKLLLRTWNSLSLELKKQCLLEALYNRPDVTVALNDKNIDVDEYVSNLDEEQLDHIFKECIIDV